jgi:acetyl esterase/lipase
MTAMWAAVLAAACCAAGRAADRPKSAAPRVEVDVAYAAGGDRQKLDLYLPAKKGFATVVFIYGGGWHTGSRKSVTVVGKKLQSLGYGCALISHRLSPQDKFPAQVEDTAAAFAWVKKQIGARGGNPRRVFLMGHSSGAHLALLLATDPIYLARHKLAPADVRGVVGLSPPVDLGPRKDGRGFGDALLAGRGADVFSRDPAVMRDASPVRHLGKHLPPTLLVVGERDFPMLEGDAKAFAQKAKRLGLRVPVHVAKGCNHMAVVRGLLDDKGPVLAVVQKFLAKRTK